ncbi:hypothetical protein [Rhodohalobacter sp.]|uniref:hypothetical protein n=1 Tax=Rhodohalobacter sp. TaxID=1974210 RepID=UPI003563C24E
MSNSSNNKFLNSKGSRLSIAAFLLLIIPLIVGCESPGSVGEGLGPDGSSVTTDEYSVTDVSSVEENFFSGGLSYSAMGYIEDPVYGTLNAVAVLKPVISTSAVDTLVEGDTMTLRMVFNSSIYGDELSVSDYEIFELEDQWRGNELKYNEAAPVDFSSKVAEFQVADEDTVEVELSAEWVEKYSTYFNSDDANRDSLYTREFTGLAIVPAETNSRVKFLRHTPADEEEDPAITEFRIYSTEFDEEEDEDVEVVSSLGLRDWGAYVVRSDEPDYDSGNVLHSIDRLMEVNLNLPFEDLQSKNIVNASLIFSIDRSDEQLNSSIVRPDVESIRAHTFSTPPADLISEIFATPARFGANINEDEEIFKVDVTQYILDTTYGDVNAAPLYFSAQSVNGILYSIKLHDNAAPQDRQPRLIITSVE